MNLIDVISSYCAETPAEWGGVQQAIRDSAQRYDALGVLEWAVQQAAKDAANSVRCWETFLSVHRLETGGLSTLRSYFSALWFSGTFVPLAKWAIAVPLASMSGYKDGNGVVKFRELPPVPSLIPEGSNPLRVLFRDHNIVAKLRTRLHEKKGDKPTRRAYDLAWSLLGSKAMFPSLWVDATASALRDHAELLSASPPPMSDKTFDMLTLVAESVSRLATPKVTTYERLPRPKLSASSGWVKLFDEETKRFTTMRGTRAAQLGRLEGIAGDAARPLFSMDYRPRSGVVEFRQHPYEFRWDDWDFDPKVSVVALQEPFKIRTISIADGPATAAGSPLQKLWHKTLKALWPFSLIGGERVASRVLQGGKFAFDGTPFVSGDYSAATDRLSMTCSQVVLQTLLRRIALPAELRRRLEVSLTSSQLDYSKVLEPFRDRVPDALLDSIKLPSTTDQKNGQLMGNILSFPILCLVNLTGYLLAMDGTDTAVGAIVSAARKRGYFYATELDGLPVLINGDDILFQCDPETYRRWLDIIGELGFKTSLGKNYYSPDFFTINSELYTRDGFRSRPWWGGFETDLIRLRNEIKFEIGEDVLQADMTRVMPKMQEYLKMTVSESAWPTVNKAWIEHYRSSGILDPYKGLNWFLPTRLGGLGLNSAGFDYVTTYAQVKLANRLHLDPDSPVPRMPGAQSSLVTESSKKRVRGMYDTKYMSGERVIDERGIKYVLDREQPLALRSGQVYYRGHAMVDDLVAHTPHVDSWLDFHVQGIRLEAERVSRAVTQALHWGLQLSDRKVKDLKDLDLAPRYKCVTSVTHLVPGYITRL